jgi:hypothetical protein
MELDLFLFLFLNPARSPHIGVLGAALRVGVSRQAIIAIETGRFDPSLPLAFKLAPGFWSGHR